MKRYSIQVVSENYSPARIVAGVYDCFLLLVLLVAAKSRRLSQPVSAIVVVFSWIVHCCYRALHPRI